MTIIKIQNKISHETKVKNKFRAKGGRAMKLIVSAWNVGKRGCEFCGNGVRSN